MREEVGIVHFAQSQTVERHSRELLESFLHCFASVSRFAIRTEIAPISGIAAFSRPSRD